MSNAASITSTINAQIGNPAFVMMGAHSKVITSEGALQWQIRGCRKISHITVKLESDDTYTVTFQKVSRNRRTFEVKVTKVAEVSDVYADSLHQVIESATGLYLSL